MSSLLCGKDGGLALGFQCVDCSSLAMQQAFILKQILFVEVIFILEEWFIRLVQNILNYECVIANAEVLS